MRWQRETGAGLAAIFGAMAFMPAGPALSDELDLGSVLYDQYCAACHGADLEGAPDWQRSGPDGRFPAPPHAETGHNWHHGDRMLFAYTKYGGQAYLDGLGVAFNSGMPAFGDVLSEEEIKAILAFIRSTWPARIQEIQAERTAAESAE